MAVFHDEVEIEDFQYDEDSETYFYPCPCGDNFSITKVILGPSGDFLSLRVSLPVSLGRLSHPRVLLNPRP